MTNITVIYPQPNEYKEPRFGFSYDWATLGTVLHCALLRDYSVTPFDQDIFVMELQDNNIQIAIIEFDSFALKRSENILHGQELINIIQQTNPHIKIIAYGHYPCITKQNIEGADITIRENNLNVIFEAIHTLRPDLLSLIRFDTFDDFPIIDRPFLNRSIPYFEQHRKSTLVQTAVGCENTCIFCQRKSWQQKFMIHSDSYIFIEFEELQKQGIANLWITDENFTFDLTRAKRILTEFVAREITIDMNICISSWTNIDDKFLDIAKTANIKTISFGIETGNTDIQRFYRKNINLQKVKAVMQYADKIGIYTIGNFILGAPMETKETIKHTFDFIRECNFDAINCKILAYMRGAELFSNLPIALQNQACVFACKENGLCNFPLLDLESIKNEFLQQYYLERKDYLKWKIDKFGVPYK